MDKMDINYFKNLMQTKVESHIDSVILSDTALDEIVEKIIQGLDKYIRNTSLDRLNDYFSVMLVPREGASPRAYHLILDLNEYYKKGNLCDNSFDITIFITNILAWLLSHYQIKAIPHCLRTDNCATIIRIPLDQFSDKDNDEIG